MSKGMIMYPNLLHWKCRNETFDNLSPEEACEGQLRHSRFGSSSESEIQNQWKEAPVEGPLEQTEAATYKTKWSY